jgi:hypothetical protein
MDVFVWLENSAFFSWVRESSSLLAYPTVIFLHTLGLAFLVGINIAVALRILGIAPMIPLTPLRRFIPIMWAGFAVNATSGTILLIQDATTKLANPVFYVKMVVIALAIVAVQFISRRVFRDPLLDKRPMGSTEKFLAVASIVLWIGAITAGRLMAYLGPVSGLAGN